MLSFTKLFVDTPLWVVKLFVPDLYIIIWVSVILAVSGGIIKCVRIIRR